jgi:hypothetical protein
MARHDHYVPLVAIDDSHHAAVGWPRPDRALSAAALASSEQCMPDPFRLDHAARAGLRRIVA